MTSEQYFEHLCKTEAGEFIFRTVENVEGLYSMRPRKEATDDELSHLYALEDPYGHTNGEADRGEYHFVSPNRYTFLERPIQSPNLSSNEMPNVEKFASYERFSGYDARHLQSMQPQQVQAVLAANWH